ncbi:MAG TPA: WD40 repeat domain-containing protein [Gemmataceae bacterium]|nr:WD40 repeat domain-containing protein [Gemmataceae bacterium]
MDPLRKHFRELTEEDEPRLRAELLRRAATDFERVGDCLAAAECWEKLGEPGRAGDLYQRADQVERAAQQLLAAGRYAEAMALYQAWEKQLPPEDEAAHVQAQLGRAACHILGRNRSPAAPPGHPQAGAEIYRQARALIQSESARDPLSAARCWAALGAFGRMVGRYDLVQVGYESALAGLKQTPAWQEAQVVCQAYLDAVQARGDRLLAQELDERRAKLRPPTLGTLLHQFPHQGIVLSVAFSPDGRQALSGGSDCLMRLWDLSTYGELQRFDHEGSVSSVVFTSDGCRALAAANLVTLWDLAAGVPLHRLGTGDAIHCAAISQDGRLTVFGDSTGALVLWDLAAGREWYRLAHDGPVHAAALSPDNRYALSASKDRTLRLWDLDYRREVCRLVHEAPVRGLALSPGGHYALSGCEDHTLRLWSLRRRQELHRFAHDGPVLCVATGADGRYAVSGGADRTVRFWDIKRRRELHRFNHDAVVRAVALSRDGSRALSGGDDRSMKLWQLPVASGGD